PEEVAKWNALWKVKSCKKSEEVGVFQNKFERSNVIMITPPEEGVPALIEYFSEIPANTKQLLIETCTPNNQPFSLRLRVDYLPIYEQTINNTQWVILPVNIEKWAGRKHVITIEIMSTESKNKITACLGNITFQ
ncbi:MAG: hypothetical protein ACP5KS_13135, partial [Candidatus Hydrogenedens sp.]